MIFEDSSRKRWKKAKIVFGFMVFFILVLLSGVIASILINPPLPKISENRINQRKAYRESQDILAKEASSVKNNPRASRRNSSAMIKKLEILANNASNTPQIDLSGPISSAFLVKDDPDSWQSLKQHGRELNIVFPDWYSIADNSCQVSGQIDPEQLKKISSSTDALIFPRIVNAQGSHWLGAETSQILNDSQKSACLIAQISSVLKGSDASGVNIDFENLTESDKNAYLDFLSGLAQALHAQGQLLTVDVTINDPAYDLEYIGKIADYVVVMAYDEHFSSGTPGSIASRDWFNDIVDAAVQAIPPKKVIISLGAYGYDWVDGSSKPARGEKYADIMKLASDSDSQPELKAEYGYNWYFGYQDEKGKNHQVWFLDSVTAFNQWLEVKKHDVAGVALWRLGSEDNNYWQIFNPNIAAKDFIDVPDLNSINFETESELFHLKSDRSAGRLQLTSDTDGSIDYALYTQVPTGYDLDAVGKPVADKKLVLTFDDGPDEVYTPKILEVLKQYQVPATFFVVGEQAQRNPDLLKLISQEGNLIGNHTYLHPNIAKVSRSRLDLELNKTQRVIEAETGRKTVLFRAPYDTDSAPSTPEQLKSLAEINALGYVFAGANIDSSDWEKPGVDKIVQNVLNQVKDPSNHVIVMHDAGGDRTQTAAALKIIIPELRREGYSFVSFNEAVGLKKDDLNPPLSQNEAFFVAMTKLWSFISHWGWLVISWLFILTTLIAAFRILFLGWMVIRSAKHYKKRDYRESIEEPVTVLVPAYNEEKTIGQTLSALQKSTKKNLEILVINDGSTDDTAGETEKFIAIDPRIRLISKENGGKSSALNLGMKEAANSLVVTIDGDTILLPDTIDELTKPFLDPQVDAVCGNVEVGNVRNLLTGFQSLEYISTQNFDRRAFDELNCISVVPGATGAWRKEKIISLGGYGTDTLTEDADLTLRLLAAGGRVVYAPEARSKTEAPETVRALAKQRFRWSYGTYQCLYKNRKLFFEGSLGWVALPNMLFFQIIFPILSPIGDLVFFLSIFRGDFRAIAVGYLMFTFMDVCGSLLAFSLEKRSKKLMWLILIQRFFYRQFMYVITYQSIIAIIKGRRHGWNKLQRTGNVKG